MSMKKDSETHSKWPQLTCVPGEDFSKWLKLLKSKVGTVNSKLKEVLREDARHPRKDGRPKKIKVPPQTIEVELSTEEFTAANPTLKSPPPSPTAVLKKEKYSETPDGKLQISSILDSKIKVHKEKTGEVMKKKFQTRFKKQLRKMLDAQEDEELPVKDVKVSRPVTHKAIANPKYIRL